MKTPILVLVIVLLLFAAGGFVWYHNTNSNEQSINFEEFPSQSGIGGAPQTMSPTVEPVINGERSSVFLTPMTGVVQGGVATLQEEQGRVTVRVTVAAIPGITDPQPIHIHSGSCVEPGKIVYTLNDVKEGRSTTFLNTSLDLIKAQEPLVINIHRSYQEIDVQTSCGEIE